MIIVFWSILWAWFHEDIQYGEKHMYACFLWELFVLHSLLTNYVDYSMFSNYTAITDSQNINFRSGCCFTIFCLVYFLHNSVRGFLPKNPIPVTTEILLCVLSLWSHKIFTFVSQFPILWVGTNQKWMVHAYLFQRQAKKLAS